MEVEVEPLAPPLPSVCALRMCCWGLGGPGEEEPGRDVDGGRCSRCACAGEMGTISVLCFLLLLRLCLLLLDGSSFVSVVKKCLAFGPIARLPSCTTMGKEVGVALGKEVGVALGMDVGVFLLRVGPGMGAGVGGGVGEGCLW